jgi:hypothetical protein
MKCVDLKATCQLHSSRLRVLNVCAVTDRGGIQYTTTSSTAAATAAAAAEALSLQSAPVCRSSSATTASGSSDTCVRISTHRGAGIQSGYVRNHLHSVFSVVQFFLKVSSMHSLLVFDSEHTEIQTSAYIGVAFALLMLYKHIEH